MRRQTPGAGGTAILLEPAQVLDGGDARGHRHLLGSFVGGSSEWKAEDRTGVNDTNRERYLLRGVTASSAATISCRVLRLST